MNRREFTLRLGAAPALGVLAASARAQGEPAEGREYTRLKEPVPVAMPGKVEVIEFFGYWCPHCAAFEPMLYPWATKLPSDVNFRRIPIAFSAPQEPYQKLYYAIESLGAVPSLHGKIFVAMHQNKQRLDKEADIAALANANGVDGAKLVEAMKSFTVATKVNQAKQLSQAYRVDSVPMLAVHGRYLTSVSQAGSAERALHVLDTLIQRSRTVK
jgi:protein dithiol oxidoreductase (disulfide-forming)